MPSDTFAAGIEAAARAAETVSAVGPSQQMWQFGSSYTRTVIAAAIRALTPTDTDTAIPAGEDTDSRSRLKLFAKSPEHWRSIYDLAVTPDPVKYLARDIGVLLAASPKPDTDTAIPAGEAWKCAAQTQGTANGNDPADCDFPHCGCECNILTTRGFVDGMEAVAKVVEADAIAAGRIGAVIRSLISTASPKPDTDIDALTGCADDQGLFAQPDMDVPDTDTPVDPGVEGVREAEEVERDIRIAIWNAGMAGGMGQDLTQAFIRRAMAEPMMARALSALAVKPIAGMDTGEVEDG